MDAALAVIEVREDLDPGCPGMPFHCATPTFLSCDFAAILQPATTQDHNTHYPLNREAYTEVHKLGKLWFTDILMNIINNGNAVSVVIGVTLPLCLNQPLYICIWRYISYRSCGLQTSS